MISSKVLVPAGSFLIAVLLSFLSPPVSRQLVRAADGTTGPPPPPPPVCDASWTVTKFSAQVTGWDIAVTELPSTVIAHAGVSATEETLLHLKADVTILFTDGTSKFFPGKSEFIFLKPTRSQVFSPGQYQFPLTPQQLTMKQLIREIERSETETWDLDLFGQHVFPKLRVKKVTVVLLQPQTVNLSTWMTLICTQSGQKGTIVPLDLDVAIDAAGNGSGSR